MLSGKGTWRYIVLMYYTGWGASMDGEKDWAENDVVVECVS